MANKKRKKDSGNNRDDDDYNMNPNIKINIENILDDDSIIPEYLEELSKNFFKLANALRSKDNEDDSENNGNNGNNNRNNNGNNIEKINTNSKKGSGMFSLQKEFAEVLTFLAQSHAGNNSKKLKNDINQLLKTLYNSKQISELVYENLIAAI